LAPSSLINQFDALIRRDPAGRGLISREAELGPLCAGHLAQASADLAASARHVAIVTGFFVPDSQPPAAETDGPPGAVVLAAALESIGVKTTVVTDIHCASAVRAAAISAGVSPSKICICPQESDNWAQEFITSDANTRLTHLIAIERVGPSHDEESLSRQPRLGQPPRSQFVTAVPYEHRNRCHNMRGAVIDGSTAPLHALFEVGPRRLAGLRTIGVGDGGNEIGMGSIPWEDLVRRIAKAETACIPCRIATDWNIVAGTSNWGGFALAAATLTLVGRLAALEPMDADYHRNMLQRMVAHGPAVDGITRRREPTVDGLPFTTYIQTWLGMRRLMGFDAGS